MSVPNAPTEIVNLALDIIKTENINNVDIPDDDKIAAVCYRWYHIARQDALEGFPWSFACKRAAVPLNATAPAFGWSDAYVLPQDYLSLNFIKEQEIPLTQWNYVIEGAEIFIDNSGAESLNIGYVYNMTDVTKYSPSFKLLLAGFVAEKVVFKLTGNVGLSKRVTEMRQYLEISAKAKNGKSNPPIPYRRSRMLDARRTHSGSGTTGSMYGRN